MSELIITPKNLREINFYKKADGYLLGSDNFCVRYNHSYSISELKEANKIIKELHKKIYINVNKIFQEFELTNLKEYLLFLKDLEVDGIFFSDFGVLKICQELGIKNKCILYHETYPLNTNDLEVILSFNVQGVIISKEVEIETLKAACKFDIIGMIAFGHIEIFNSKRKLLETYLNQYALEKELVDKYNVKIKEMTRDNLYPIFQDKNGTNIFTNFVYSALKDFKELYDLNMKYFIIDSIFLDSEYVFNVLDIFDKLRKNEYIDLDKFYEESKYKLDSGFLHLDVGLIK